ncbi:FadR/GntR family transcriptional regulator [Paracoccus salipaludis]|uniref:GntR family transcriptional regulator n=1 Tax=Paracoccus salipaludis TaxID=2032623 RepID=A0A2A2GLP5_9RHOB|nr:FadR/GntR family transcriptional regulator [Paracoccus salipaludis]PAU97672.1 GntR family transcriptional regulator [Paracoccus salipaludis]
MQGDKPRRPYRVIADQILELVAENGLAPGDRLPAERELAERFGVSRPSLREALIALEVEGRLDIRMGSGIYVGAPARAAAIEGESPFEVLQARAIVESAIAEEAARRCDPAAVAAMDRILARMAEAMGDPARSLDLDGAFHIAVAMGTGNGLLADMTADIYRLRLSPFFSRLAAHFEGPGTWRLALAEHGAIRDAIAAGDAGAAREAMRHHLTESQRRFCGAFAADAA